jgi:hypothetical protein
MHCTTPYPISAGLSTTLDDPRTAAYLLSSPPG